MYIFICKGTWIYSGQYTLYLSSTLIKNSIFCCVAPGHRDIRKIQFCAMFSKSSLFKIEYSINIETQCLTYIQLYSKPHFHIFTRKKDPLPMLPESPCTPYTVQCTLYTLHFTLYTVYSTLYTVHCTLYTVYCTLNTAHCILYTVQCTLYTLHFKLYTVHHG